MISHDLKCIFIHIPKNAGTSVESVLGHHDHYIGRGKQDHRPLSEIKRQARLGFNTHLSNLNFNRKLLLDKYFNRRLKYNPRNTLRVNKTQFRKYYKFTIIRNPWDRCYSWYNNVVRDSTHLMKLGIEGDIKYDEFIYQFGGTGNLRSQLHWIADADGTIDLDFIGRFENLDQDFRIISDKLNLGNIELPHHLKSSADNKNTYNDRKLRNYIGDLFQEEISIFNYKFE